jgi:hypothetical protein
LQGTYPVQIHDDEWKEAPCTFLTPQGKFRGAVTCERTLLEEEVDIWGFMQRDNKSMNVQHKIWLQPGYAV